MNAQQIIEITETHNAENSQWARYYGLRALTSPGSVGEELENSYQQFDGVENYELCGSCSIGFTYDDVESAEKAINLIGAYNDRYGIAIIAGYNTQYGADEGEWIIPRATIMHIFDKKDEDNA